MRMTGSINANPQTEIRQVLFCSNVVASLSGCIGNLLKLNINRLDDLCSMLA